MTQRRQRLKRQANTAFKQAGVEIRETSDDTTLITSGDIWETSDDTTLLDTNGTPNAKPDVTFVQLDIKELDIPYDVIIGRPDIRQHQLLRFDPNYV